MDRFLSNRGYLTFAVGSEYLRCARAQAMSVKLTQSQVKNFAVVLDNEAAADLTDEDNFIFDKIIVLNHSKLGWDMSQEWRALTMSPWRETIKTDADMLFTAGVDHWWTALQYRDVCISTQARDFRGNAITSRAHRRLFDENHLPDVYSACTFMRYSINAQNFFNTVRRITEDWDWYANEHLLKNDDKRPRTDEIYAIAARILGVEDCTWPALVPAFVHMKEKINGLSESSNWYEQLPSYWKDGKLFVGNIQQMLPFHYHKRDWLDAGIYESIHRNYRKLHTSI